MFFSLDRAAARRRAADPCLHDARGFPWTMTFPTMCGWREQKYSTLPGVEKVTVNLSSVSSIFDLKVRFFSATTRGTSSLRALS